MKLVYLLLISLIFQLTNIPILSRGNSVNASENLETKNSNDENNPVKTVIANGYGININDAAQNAAKNALTNVVGKFIDAETKLIKKVEIENGLVNQSKNIDRNIREYSQGSISYFEIIEINNIDGIVNVTARVDVKVDDFISYIKQIAYNLKDIDTGMFNEIKANINNEDNKLDLYVEKVIKPILTGEVTEFEIGKALPFNKFPSERLNGGYWGYKVPEGSDPMKMFVVPFSLKLNNSFKKNIKEVLNNLSEGKTENIYFDNWAKMNYTQVDLNPRQKVVSYRWRKNKKSMFHFMDLFRSKFSKNLSTNNPNENIYVGLVENNQNKVSLFSISNLGLRMKNSEKYKKYYSEHIEKKSRISYYSQEKKISLVNHPFISSSRYFRSVGERKNFGLNTFFYNPIKLSLEDNSEKVIYSCTITPVSNTCNDVQIVMLSPDGTLGRDGAVPTISLLAGYFANYYPSDKPRNNSNFIFSKRDYALVFNLDLELIKNINNIKIEHTEYFDN